MRFNAAFIFMARPRKTKIGRPASYGCIRMKSKDVAELYDQLPLGAVVQIIPDRLPKMEKTKPRQETSGGVVAANTTPQTPPQITATKVANVTPQAPQITATKAAKVTPQPPPQIAATKVAKVTPQPPPQITATKAANVTPRASTADKCRHACDATFQLTQLRTNADGWSACRRPAKSETRSEQTLITSALAGVRSIKFLIADGQHEISR